MRGERLGDRALARRGGAIDGDDHCCKPASSASKLGKLVATGAMSSIVTGALPTSRSAEHTSELQSLMRISYAVFCLKKKSQKKSNLVTHNRRQESGERLPRRSK